MNNNIKILIICITFFFSLIGCDKRIPITENKNIKNSENISENITTKIKEDINIDIDSNLLSFVYDGTYKEFVISDELIPNGINVSYKNNKQINAGKYDVTILFTDTTGKYNVPDSIIVSLTILKAKVEIPSLINSSITYDGLEHVFLASNEYYEVANNKATNAGKYELNVFLKDANNYEWCDSCFDGKISYEITKAKYDMSSVSFNNAFYFFDGCEHELTIAGCLPNGVTVSYENNKLTEAGEIEATAFFAGDELNYEPIKDLKAKLIIDNDLTKAELISSGNITFDGFIGFFKVSNETENIRLSDIIEVSPKATWSLCSDILGENTIKTKICKLNVGDNKFYIVIESGDQTNINTYELTIRRREIYTVSFNTYNGTKIESQHIEEDDFANKPKDIPTRNAYVFNSWDFDFENTKITSNIIINSNWSTITYEILYELNGGINNELNPKKYTIEDEIIFKEPSKDLYEFIGWNIKKINKGTYGNITLVAEWKSIFCIENNILKGITDYGKNNFKNIIIPDIVTSIGTNAFYNCTSLTSITIPDNVTSIENCAFNGCSSLGSIVIPDSVASIGDDAFDNCTSLKSILIPDSVYSIGNNIFKNCLSLKYNEYNGTFYLGNERNHYCVLVYANCDIDSCSINENTKFICKMSFYNCASLTSITIPDNVISIGESAFKGCISLEKIIVSSKNKYYDSRENCNAIIETSTNTLVLFGCSSTIVPNGVVSIGDFAFCNCTSQTTIFIPDSVVSIGNTYIDSPIEKAIIPSIGISHINKKGLKEVTINSGESIDDNAFYNCTSLVSVTISDKITSIGKNAFFGCPIEKAIIPAAAIDSFDKNILKEIVITSGNTIGAQSFSNCKCLESIILPDTITSIGDNAFYNCTSLTSIDILEGAISIGDNAFYNCTSLVSISIPNSVTSIGDNAFYNCISLQCNEYDNAYYFGNDSNRYLVLFKSKMLDMISCTINANTKFIHSFAFNECDSLTSIDIPDNVISIGKCAFKGCTSLEIVELPFIGRTSSEYQFFGYLFGCEDYKYNNSYVPLSIRSVIIKSGCISIGDYAFYKCDSLTSITIPDSIISIGDRAFFGCSSLTFMSFPKSIKIIGSYCLWGCISLEKIELPYACLSQKKLACLGYLFGNVDGYSNANYANVPSSLKTVIITDQCKEIGNSMFSSCQYLTFVFIPSEVTRITYEAFANCTSLTCISIPKGVYKIGYCAFNGCSKLKDIYYEGTEDEWNSIEIDDGNNAIKNATIHYNYVYEPI